MGFRPLQPAYSLGAERSFGSVLSAVFIFLVFLLLVGRLFVFDIVQVCGDSMVPTYASGQKTLCIRLDKPDTNDIVVADAMVDGRETCVIKRAVACPGDTVEIRDNTLYVNGTESKTSGEGTAYCPGSDRKIVLQDGEYYLLGDNRVNSYDSREFGPVNRGDIRGVIWR